MTQLKRRMIISFPRLLIIIGAWHLFGCSSETEPIPEETPITFPAEFEEDGTKWNKVETIAESEMQQVADYFKKNSSLAEGPIVSGDPIQYTSSDGKKRFYWGRPGTDAPQWFYIEFSGRKATVEEGSGAPLSSESE